jgi:hypothetical protein
MQFDKFFEMREYTTIQSIGCIGHLDIFVLFVGEEIG